MLVYDITNEKSFDNIKNWIRNIEEVTHTTYIFLNSSFLAVLALLSALFLAQIYYKESESAYV